MEVVRDKADNCIIVCSIENLDPMGVHTGDSITVAPAQTLTDKEYQRLRDASIAVLREIGVETGGSNVQFGVNPRTGRVVVIEMNPRVSRSSALASKATGFPIAKVAAKLAVGYTLDELRNEITGGRTPASFEPTIDYVVTKVPRFAFEKFPQAEARLTTQMKSVGEVMAIGRTFQESLQKALRGLETGKVGLDPTGLDLADPEAMAVLRRELKDPGPDRLFHVADAFRAGMGVEEVYALSAIDPWFLDQIADIVAAEQEVAAGGLDALDARRLRELKRMGFSDARLAQLVGTDEGAIRALRRAHGVRQHQPHEPDRSGHAHQHRGQQGDDHEADRDDEEVVPGEVGDDGPVAERRRHPALLVPPEPDDEELQDQRDAERRDHQLQRSALIEAAQQQPFGEEAEQRAHPDAGQDADDERQLPDGHDLVRDVAAEGRHHPVREVEHPGGPVDRHQAEGHDGVQGPGDDRASEDGAHARPPVLY